MSKIKPSAIFSSLWIIARRGSEKRFWQGKNNWTPAGVKVSKNIWLIIPIIMPQYKSWCSIASAQGAINIKRKSAVRL